MDHQFAPVQRYDGHLIVYLAWPLLAGLGLAMVISLSLAGVVGLWMHSLASAAIWGAFAFFIVWGLSTLAVFWYAARSWGGPLAIERLKQPVEHITRAPAVIDERPPMIVRGYTSPPLLEASLESNIQPIDPDAGPEIKNLYKFVTTMWPTGDITQNNCMIKGFSRRDWDRYIGGSRRKADIGTDSGRGLLDRAGIIVKQGNEWRIAADLADALAINDDLLRYATARSKIVKIR